MEILQERQFEIDLSQNEIGARLDKWANSSGFVCTTITPQRWVFERGSKLAALYSFDIKKIPTNVYVSLLASTPASLHCSFKVKSSLAMQTSGDSKRVSEQLDVLVSYIKGAL